jgi:hypothetical protein
MNKYYIRTYRDGTIFILEDDKLSIKKIVGYIKGNGGIANSDNSFRQLEHHEIVKYKLLGIIPASVA